MFVLFFIGDLFFVDELLLFCVVEIYLLYILLFIEFNLVILFVFVNIDLLLFFDINIIGFFLVIVEFVSVFIKLYLLFK